MRIVFNATPPRGTIGKNGHSNVVSVCDNCIRDALFWGFLLQESELLQISEPQIMASTENERRGTFDDELEVLDKKSEIPSTEKVKTSSRAMTRFCFLSECVSACSMLSLKSVASCDFPSMRTSLNKITPASTKVKTINVPSDIRFARASRGTKQAITAATNPVIKIPSDMVFVSVLILANSGNHNPSHDIR
mmetsp:Transcript_4557/g.10993  ORF Transcript_4557/g.10993 Transcript_4557/m.10993 type:complete len:192 (+) Transcript_4557:211-786(+)